MQEIIDKLTAEKRTAIINENMMEIFTDAEIERGVDIRIFIKKIGDRIFISDDKNTLRFMNTKYELGARDVKQCINDLVKNYGFIIEKGELLAELKSTDNVIKRFNDLLICSCSLANMHIFFDTPID